MAAFAHITQSSRCVIARLSSRDGGQFVAISMAKSPAAERILVYRSGCPSIGLWYLKLFWIWLVVFSSGVYICLVFLAFGHCWLFPHPPPQQPR